MNLILRIVRSRAVKIFWLAADTVLIIIALTVLIAAMFTGWLHTPAEVHGVGGWGVIGMVSVLMLCWDIRSLRR